MSDSLILSTQPELLRLNQKDEEYIFGFYSKLMDAIEIFTPTIISYRTISNNKDNFRLLIQCAYYGLTTLSNRKTLGEEFSNLEQFNKEDFDWEGKPTIMRRRLLFFILNCLSPYILQKLVKNKYDLSRNRAKDSRENYLNFVYSIIRNLPSFDEINEKILKMHLCSFLLDGLHIQLSKRLTKLFYVFNRSPRNHGISYVKVGKLMAIQLLIEFVRFIYLVHKDYQKSKFIQQNKQTLFSDKLVIGTLLEQDECDEVPSKLQCNLCYERRKFTSITPCGHLFCWECVIKSTQIKPECPNCRASCQPQKVIQLANFS